jgi:von Willebrand factor type A domain
MSRLRFGLSVESKLELPKDASEIAALVTVRASQDEGGAMPESRIAEVIIMDRSGSMHRYGKLDKAKQAVGAAIDALADGTRFAVIAGHHDVTRVYPRKGGLAAASDRARRNAKNLVFALVADGGTAMSRWILQADDLFAGEPEAVRHAVLYTDGINESEPAENLDKALKSCRDSFTCDLRGVGTDWDHRQLRQIADAMQGRVEAIIDIADLRADFASLMADVQRRHVPAVSLRLTLDRRFRLKSVRQVHPVNNDLTDRCAPQDGGTVDVSLLAWGEEADSTALPYEEVRAVRIDLMADRSGTLEIAAAPQVIPVLRQRSRDLIPVSIGVTTAGWHADLAEAERAGIAAYERGDQGAAEHELAAAFAIARRLGARGHLDRLSRLIVIDESGDARLRPGISKEDVLMLATYARDHSDVLPPSSTGVKPDEGPPPGEEPEVVRVCPRGHTSRGRVVRFCEESGCDHIFTD